MACLIIVSGEQKGTYFSLKKRPLAGGRDPANEIQIIDAKVSRRHFRVGLVEDAYTIRELKSRNGVLVNGVRITGDHHLKDNDDIQVGDTRLVFLDSDDPDRSNAIEKYRKASRELREDRTLGD